MPGPTSSSTKSSRAVAVAARDRERARQERPLVRAAAPALGGGEHVELARVGRRPAGSATREHDVGAERAAPAITGSAPAAERRERAVAHVAATAPPPVARWISCSERTGGAPWRAAAIARAAAMPPAIVVMHGTPRAIAARRIS